jgi:hypothetical protein
MGQDVVITGRNELPKAGNFAYSKASVTSKGRLPVETYHQDQTTRPIGIKINQVLDDTITLSTAPTVNSYTVALTAGHGVANGNKLAFLEQNGSPQIFYGVALNVATNTITMDSPVPFSFTPADTTVLKYNDNLIVNGSGTAIVANMHNYFTNKIDITRFIFHIEDDVAMDTAKFGGITALTRGLVLRKNNGDGTYTHYWNVKKNGELAELAYDLEYDSKAPAGSYALRCRLSYGGEQKHGVVIRLEPGQAVEVLIQDDLTALEEFDITVEGHVVEG